MHTVSSASTYFFCPRQYYLQYKVRVSEEPSIDLYDIPMVKGLVQQKWIELLVNSPNLSPDSLSVQQAMDATHEEYLRYRVRSPEEITARLALMDKALDDLNWTESRENMLVFLNYLNRETAPVNYKVSEWATSSYPFAGRIDFVYLSTHLNKLVVADGKGSTHLSSRLRHFPYAASLYDKMGVQQQMTHAFNELDLGGKEPPIPEHLIVASATLPPLVEVVSNKEWLSHHLLWDYPSLVQLILYVYMLQQPVQRIEFWYWNHLVVESWDLSYTNISEWTEWIFQALSGRDISQYPVRPRYRFCQSCRVRTSCTVKFEDEETVIVPENEVVLSI